MNKVILVDDEMYFRKGLRNMIDWKECGFEVVGEASNGEDAFELIRRVNPDLVITDIRMPILDGLELIKSVDKEKEIDSKFIIISGHSDFAYAQQAVRFGVHDFILKPIDQDEIEETLKTLSQTMDEQKRLQEKNQEVQMKVMLDNLLFGNVDDHFLSASYKALSLSGSDKFYYVIVEINKIQEESASMSGDYFHLEKAKVSKIFEDQIGNNDKLLIHEISHGTLGLLVTSKILAKFQNSIDNFLTWTIKEIAKQLANDVMIYVGHPVIDPLTIKQSYDAALKAQQYKYTQENQGIIYFEEVQDQTLQYTELDDSFYQLLIEQIEEEKTNTVVQSIEDIFSELSSRKMSQSAVLSSVNHIVHSMLKIIKKMGGDPAKLESFPIIHQLQTNHLTLKQLKKVMSEFLLECKEQITELRKQSANGEANKIKQYVDLHFNENISLKTIAAKFYMNPVYLGQLFKKTYGMYFKDYLLQVRINEAKKQLRQSEKRIYEIAESVGFNNTDYFVTIFGKLENQTPSEYRNKLTTKEK